jgi:hypothetical protein
LKADIEEIERKYKDYKTEVGELRECKSENRKLKDYLEKKELDVK